MTKHKIERKEQKTEQPMVMVACPNNRAERSEYCTNAYFSMGWYAAANGIKAASYTFDEHPLSLARNAAMKMFEENPQFSHLLFLDSDVVPPIDIIPRFVAHDVPTISGWYLGRKGASIPLIFKLENKQFLESNPPMSSFLQNPKQFPNFKPYQLGELLILPKDKKTGLTQVDGVAMGCVMLKREILSHLSKPYFYEDPINFHSFGEDLWFSLNCKIANIPIQLDLSAFCAHVAWGLIDMRHVQALLRRSQQIQQQNPLTIQKARM